MSAADHATTIFPNVPVTPRSFNLLTRFETSIAELLERIVLKSFIHVLTGEGDNSGTVKQIAAGVPRIARDLSACTAVANIFSAVRSKQLWDTTQNEQDFYRACTKPSLVKFLYAEGCQVYVQLLMEAISLEVGHDLAARPDWGRITDLMMQSSDAREMIQDDDAKGRQAWVLPGLGEDTEPTAKQVAQYQLSSSLHSAVKDIQETAMLGRAAVFARASKANR